MMPPSAAPLPDRDGELRLHQRLLCADATASSELAVTYLEPLISWLTDHNRTSDPVSCSDAAGEAILALIRNPAAYNPERQTLLVYLRLSAQRDLQNVLRKEEKHHRHRIPWPGVELLPDAGKYLRRDDDPSLPMQATEEAEALLRSVPASVREGLTDEEGRVLDLMLRGERHTSVYAEACRISHLPPAEQEKRVKRLKDRLTKRLQRARPSHEPTS